VDSLRSSLVRQVAPHTIVGGPVTYASKEEKEEWEELARQELRKRHEQGKTVGEWHAIWTDPDGTWGLKRRSKSTLIHNAERTRRFVEAYRDRPLVEITRKLVVEEWLRYGERNMSTVPALRAMFSDAAKVMTGELIPRDRNPFGEILRELGISGSKGRREHKPPSEAKTVELLAIADQISPPSFAAFLRTAIYTGARPGELDALRWTDLDFTPGRSVVHIRGQWNNKAKEYTEPKRHSDRHVAMVDELRDYMLAYRRTHGTRASGCSRRCSARRPVADAGT
jgi:integrase